MFADTPDSILAEVVARHIWPEVIPRLLSYGVVYQAGDWERRHFGDAALYYEPVQEGNTCFDVQELTAWTEEEAQELLRATVMDADDPKPVVATLQNSYLGR